MQSRRFALQELLKQFLLTHHRCTSIFLFHKKVQSRVFAICTTTVRAVSYSIKKVCKQNSSYLSSSGICLISEKIVQFFYRPFYFKKFTKLKAYSSPFCLSISTIFSFFIGILQFLLLPNSTITTSSIISITTPKNPLVVKMLTTEYEHGLVLH